MPHSLYSAMGRHAWIYDSLLRITGYSKLVRIGVSEMQSTLRGNMQTVLDVGTGSGIYAFEILRQLTHARITAVDLDSEMIRHVRKRAEKEKVSERLSVLQADILNDGKALNSQSFDAIVTGGVFEHLQLQEGIAKLNDSLKPGGVFLNSYVKNNAMGRLIGKIYGFAPYKEEELLAAFENEGSQLKTKLDTTKPWQYKGIHLFRKKD